MESHIITASMPAIKNLDRSIHQAGISISGQILVPLAAARAVLTKRQKELGVALVDIGAGTTGIAVYEEGDILYSSVIPVGAGHITNDLAIGLKTSVDTAEKIKLKYVRAHTSKANLSEKIRIEELDSEDNVITRRELQNIAGARLDEIFHLVRLELKKVGKDVMLPGGVVLTGGGAKMIGIEDLAKEALQLPVTIGKPEGFSGIVDRINDPAFAAPVGLMLENMSHVQMEPPAGASIGQTVTKLKGIFKNLLP